MSTAPPALAPDDDALFGESRSAHTQAGREARRKHALAASIGYTPRTEAVRFFLLLSFRPGLTPACSWQWFHPHKDSSADEPILELSAEQLIALIQHDFLRKNYPRIIHTAHAFIAHHHPDPTQPNNTEATRKLALILESTLICFKKLFLQNDPPDQALLLQFLDWSRPFYQLVPSLGIPAASLLIKLNQPDQALKAITPALLHSGSPRIREIIKEAMICSSDPKASARGLVHDLILLQESNKAPLKLAIQHLGLAGLVSTFALAPSTSSSENPSSSSDLESWSSCILLALQESGLETN